MLRPVSPGLRPLRNRTNGVAKVDLRVPVGDVMHVSDDVAEQLIGSGQFTEVTPATSAPVVAEDVGENPTPEVKRARRPKP